MVLGGGDLAGAAWFVPNRTNATGSPSGGDASMSTAAVSAVTRLGGRFFVAHLCFLARPGARSWQREARWPRRGSGRGSPLRAGRRGTAGPGLGRACLPAPSSATRPARSPGQRSRRSRPGPGRRARRRQGRGSGAFGRSWSAGPTGPRLRAVGHLDDPPRHLRCLGVPARQQQRGGGVRRVLGARDPSTHCQAGVVGPSGAIAAAARRRRRSSQRRRRGRSPGSASLWRRLGVRDRAGLPVGLAASGGGRRGQRVALVPGDKRAGRAPPSRAVPGRRHPGRAVRYRHTR